MNPGVIICSRLSSKRIPSKAIVPINGKPALWWLLKRLEKINIPVVLAVPEYELGDYISIFQTEFRNILFFSGSEKNVLERMYMAANKYSLDPIVRITHDDLLIDSKLLSDMLARYIVRNNCKYMFCSSAVEGTAAEIISFENIQNAYFNHKGLNIEHISYFVKNNKDECHDFEPKDEYLKRDYRLTLDYPKDHLLLEILSRFVDFGNTRKIVNFIEDNPFLLEVNELPKITIFISCFNGSQYLKESIESVRKQTFKDFEFYFVDDGSTDDSLRIAANYDDIKIIVNSKNMGIAHSSNRILERAKGKYIIRLDSDDVLLPRSLENLYTHLENNPTWSICYSGYYETDEKMSITKEVKKNKAHHIAGSLISKKALNEIKFKEGLRHFDSQELYKRMSRSFDYGYLQEPLFCYRQHNKSWSQTAKNLKTRIKIRRELNL